ncbi:MAG: Efflux ABC transporter, permease protein [uncultured Thermomicrobiales bacterium]|uniref:Efflux ABC transporter, permease protein n=1 Tax=uncultured Thermomicrobiales bacterium TaxID=1645740 RepID=A0A6J4VRL7_9BACT|nr:MAG: Efflux ABC transporter, permease protein [uncultured Thermomicrobiales bacterium]
MVSNGAQQEQIRQPGAARREPGLLGRLARAFVRTSSFIGKELTEVRRQPRLLLSLVLGPFLILFLFGVGYGSNPRDIKTVVVIPSDSPLTNNAEQYSDAFAKPFVLDGVTADGQVARQRLADREIQAVIYFPQNAYETVLSGQRAVLQVEYNEIDPLTAQWVNYYSYVQTNELNKRILIEALKQGGVGQGGDQQRAEETKTLATTMQADAGALRAAMTGGDRNTALARLAAIRQNNAKAQQNILTSAQLLGGVALFTNVQNPQQTKQGQALTAAQTAIGRIDENANRLQGDIQSGQTGQQQQALAEQIGQDTQAIGQSSDQLKLIPPEILVSPFVAESQNISSIAPDFVEFYAPAVIALLIQHIAVTLTALTLVRERLLGSVELFRVTPTGAGEIAIGKYIAYFLLTAVIGAALAAAMHLGLGVHILAGYAQFAGAIVLLILASLSFGFFISAISNSESQAVQFSMLVLLASVFFSGFFIGLESLAPYVRVVSYALPVTYGIRALQAVMLRGEQPELWVYGALVAMALLLFFVSSQLFRLQFKRG